MHCLYCKAYLGEAYYDGYHSCPNEPPTDWPRAIRWMITITAIVFLLIW